MKKSKRKNNKTKVDSIEVTEESVESFITRSIVAHGEYVNNGRHMPYLFGGMKPSYRRMIYTALTFPDKMTKVATLIGECGGKYSPHNPESLSEVVSEMVRVGIFDGQGAHGSPNIYKELSEGPAAPRYIEAKLNTNYRSYLSKLIKHVPFINSDLDFPEPLYIPSPIPLSLLYGTIGLGSGIRSVVPNFSAKSMLEALEKDDYNLLKPNSNLSIDKRKSNLQGVWETGKGKITYKFKLDLKASYEGKDGIAISGDSRFISISKLGKLADTTKSDPKNPKGKKLIEPGWISKGQVIMLNQSSKSLGNKSRLFFYLKPNQKGKDRVTFDMLKDELNTFRYITIDSNLAVTDSEISRVTPLKSWLGECYGNFEEVFDKYKKSQSTRLRLDLEISKWSKKIANLLIKNDKASVKDIAEELNISEAVVKGALAKSISVLRRDTYESDKKDITSKLNKLKKLKPKDLYENIIE